MSRATTTTVPVEDLKPILDCPPCSGTGFAGPCPECHGTEPDNATEGCDTCLGFGGYGSCSTCAGTGSTMATPEERAAQRIMDLLLKRKAH